MTALLATLAMLTGGPAQAEPFVGVIKRAPLISRYCDRRCHVVRYKRRTVRPYRAKLERMAWCESTGRWYIATGNGFYGGLQFDAQTWRSVGGTGLPHQNSKLEQMFRAVLLIRQRGYSPWPRCGFV